MAGVGAGVLTHRLKLALIKATPEHLGVALGGVVQGGLHGACKQVVTDAE